MKLFLRIISVICASLTALTLVSCGEKRDEYYVNTLDTGSDTLTVSVAYDSGTKNEKNKKVYFTDEELDDVFSKACDIFTKSLEYVSPDSKDSQLGEINSRVNTVFECDAELISLLNTSYSLCACTGGAFQPCGGTLTALRNAFDTPADEDIAAALTHVGTDKITFSGTTVNKVDLDTKIDLYAMADGYALGKVIDYLSDECLYGFVTLDSMAGVFGEKKSSSTFDIGVLADGDDGARQGYMRLKTGYISVSDKSVSEEIDFSTGQTAADQLSKVIVWSDDPLTADAVASAAYVMGADRLLDLYADSSLSFEAVLVHPDASVVVTDGAVEAGLYSPETTTAEK